MDLYVSADVVMFLAPAMSALAPDVSQGDADGVRAYRRLDGCWFAWLSQNAYAYADLALVRQWLIDRHGPAAVSIAERLLLPRDYAPPTIAPSMMGTRAPKRGAQGRSPATGAENDAAGPYIAINGSLSAKKSSGECASVEKNVGSSGETGSHVGQSAVACGVSVHGA